MNSLGVVKINSPYIKKHLSIANYLENIKKKNKSSQDIHKILYNSKNNIKDNI